MLRSHTGQRLQVVVRFANAPDHGAQLDRLRPGAEDEENALQETDSVAGLQAFMRDMRQSTYAREDARRDVGSVRTDCPGLG